jgi:hypothetical protein
VTGAAGSGGGPGPALFPDGLRIVNLGLPAFAEAARAHGAEAIQLDWRPPAGADRELGLLVARLEDDADDPAGGAGRVIGQGNVAAVERILGARPMLLDVRPAGEVIPFLGEGRALLHGGPPIEWPRMCGPMQGAAMGALLFEGWSATPEEARAMLDEGVVAFAPCHHHGAVGPMAGLVAPSMPVVVVEDRAHGNRAFATLNEGLGAPLRRLR